jgi:alpha-galactosidase
MKIIRICRTVFLVFIGLTLIFDNTATAQAADVENPFAASSTDFQQWTPRLPDDALMPNPDMIKRVENWSKAAFAGKKNVTDAGNLSLQLIRQDHNTLKFDESCMGTPLKIGSRSFARGLGTHANSEIRITFPEPVTKFSAFVGIDNNYDTAGVRGSAQFAVVVEGKELMRTQTLLGSDGAFAIDLPLPEKTTVLTLVVDAADNTGWDQSDWCEPTAVGVSGKIYHLSDAKSLPMSVTFPFSFQYGGIPSSELLPQWKFGEKNIDKLNTVYFWTDPKTGLKVSALVRRFERFAGVDWVLNFENTGTKDTPLIENVKIIDMDFSMGVDRKPLVIHTLSGDSCDRYSWLPVEHLLLENESKHFAPHGGRSSNGAFPFWNIQSNDNDDIAVSDGVFVALGWSGQWAADFLRKAEQGLTVSAGMEKISTVLYPSETIRSPRVLIMPWKSDRLTAHALFRRLLMFEYAPKMQDGLPQHLLSVGQCFDRYYRKRPGWEKFDGQAAFVQKLHEAGCNAHWFDAAWFPVGFPDGVGNWFSDPDNFPQGVEALGKVVHDLGMKFVLWFEPERVAKGTQIAEQYPQYVFGGENGGLFKLNDPEARTFLTELLLTRIKQFGVDVYRNDFNIDPLGFWRANDEPNRQGITEIRYVEGHYEMWNRFRKEVPGLWIDNCASGGRRIDLETISISVPLWRSDTCCWSGHPEWDQTQTLGLTQYIPLFACVAWESDPYIVRSSASMGPIFQFNFLDDDYQLDLARQAILESKIHQKFWYGDFYPLSDAKVGQGEITAWQLHRADLGAGLVYIFRQQQSPYLGRELLLRAIDPDAQYRVRIKQDYSPGAERFMSGRELTNVEIAVPNKRSAIVIQYQHHQSHDKRDL